MLPYLSIDSIAKDNELKNIEIFKHSPKEFLILLNILNNGKHQAHILSYLVEKEAEMIDWLSDMRLPLYTIF